MNAYVNENQQVAGQPVVAIPGPRSMRCVAAWPGGWCCPATRTGTRPGPHGTWRCSRTRSRLPRSPTPRMSGARSGGRSTTDAADHRAARRPRRRRLPRRGAAAAYASSELDRDRPGRRHSSSRRRSEIGRAVGRARRHRSDLPRGQQPRPDRGRPDHRRRDELVRPDVRPRGQRHRLRRPGRRARPGRHVTRSEDPDLFWALRGGGGDFGIITALEISAGARVATSTAVGCSGRSSRCPPCCGASATSRPLRRTSCRCGTSPTGSHPCPRSPSRCVARRSPRSPRPILGADAEAERLLQPLRAVPGLALDLMGPVADERPRPDHRRAARPDAGDGSLDVPRRPQ